MDAEKKWYKHWLSSIDEESVEDLCRLARLTEEEVMIIVMTCCRWHDEFYIADQMNMSSKNLHKRKMFAVDKLLCWCRKQYSGEDLEKRKEILWEKILNYESKIAE